MYQMLDIDLSWKSGDLHAFIPILVALVFFEIYWFTAKSQKIKDYFYSKYSFNQASEKHIFFTKYFGFFIMGVVPTLVCLLTFSNYSLADYGLTIIPETTFFSLIWSLGLCIIVVPLAYFSAKNPENLRHNPQIRAIVWTRRTNLNNAFGWFLYLFGYELLFRGILLFPLVDAIGVWPAIAVNVAFYSATHIPKGLSETVSAIPFGLVLCLLTLASGTIWIAFIAHVALAWTSSFASVKFHPDIHYAKGQK